MLDFFLSGIKTKFKPENNLKLNFLILEFGNSQEFSVFFTHAEIYRNETEKERRKNKEGKEKLIFH